MKEAALGTRMTALCQTPFCLVTGKARRLQRVLKAGAYRHRVGALMMLYAFSIILELFYTVADELIVHEHRPALAA
jgi:hypothetical protein